MNRFMMTMAVTAVLGASGHAMSQENIPRNAALNSVRTIHLQTNGCTPQLNTELQTTGGYGLGSDLKGADASLKVDVHQLDANTGASARFSASLRDQGGKELFSTTGREDSISQEELCEDIAEEIAERMVERRAAIR